MIRALGFSHNEFNADKPGRLCRGRERWIEPWLAESPSDPIHRLVITGASFEDDSASEALRGVTHSGVELAQVIASLFPRKRFLVFTEDGHPADIPPEAQGIEAYEGYRAGGMTELGLVRWYCLVQGIRDIRAILGDPTEERVRGFAVLEDDTDVDALWESLFLLVGMSTLDSPPARFQPAAFSSVLQHVKALVLLHRDKHGPALGVYSSAPVKTDSRLDSLCDKAGALLVPFAIPPMLARWDRALSELRAEWVATREDAFPVPAAPESHSWENRRRGRRGRNAPKAETAATPAESSDEPAESSDEPTEASAEPERVEAPLEDALTPSPEATPPLTEEPSPVEADDALDEIAMNPDGSEVAAPEGGEAADSEPPAGD